MSKRFSFRKKFLSKQISKRKLQDDPIEESSKVVELSQSDKKLEDIRVKSNASADFLSTYTKNILSSTSPHEEESSDNKFSNTLKLLYASRDTLPKLIDDENIQEQKWQDYYVKLEVAVEEKDKDDEDELSTVPRMRAIDTNSLFDQCSGKDSNKVLLVGGAGTGKTTMLDYAAHSWSTDKLWNGKFEYVFRLHLKELLNKKWGNGYNGNDLKKDPLLHFIDYCLDDEAYRLHRDKKLGEKIEFNFEDLKNVLRGDAKVLFLIDGYDEVVDLVDSRDRTTETIIDQLISGKNPKHKILMSSRPDAASGIREKFDRVVENRGFDDDGVFNYIERAFTNRDESEEEPELMEGSNKLAQSLIQLVNSNAQLREMCTVPINTAMVCLIWYNPDSRAKISAETNLNLASLYDEILAWLGNRYLNKSSVKYSSQKDYISSEFIHKIDEVSLIKWIAHKSFVETGKLVTSEVIKSSMYLYHEDSGNRTRIDSSIVESVLKFGVLKREGANYQFIHLSFQEYLTAHYLKEKLASKDQTIAQETAKFIASHRGDPKFLMTLKFLSGMVDNEGKQELTTRFWEAVSCNIDGVIELGVDNKVKLFMHLLAQTKTENGDFNEKIPNIGKIDELIFLSLKADFTKWRNDIIESGFLSVQMTNTIKGSFEVIKHLGKNENITGKPIVEAIKDLSAVLDVSISLAGKKGLPSKRDIYKLLIDSLYDTSCNQPLQAFVLSKMEPLIDGTLIRQIPEITSKDLNLLIKLILTNDSLSGLASRAIRKVTEIDPETNKAVLNSYIGLLSFIDLASSTEGSVAQVDTRRSRRYSKKKITPENKNQLTKEKLLEKLPYVIDAMSDTSSVIDLIKELFKTDANSEFFTKNFPQIVVRVPDIIDAMSDTSSVVDLIKELFKTDANGEFFTKNFPQFLMRVPDRDLPKMLQWIKITLEGTDNKLIGGIIRSFPTIANKFDEYDRLQLWTMVKIVLSKKSYMMREHIPYIFEKLNPEEARDLILNLKSAATSNSLYGIGRGEIAKVLYPLIKNLKGELLEYSLDIIELILEMGDEWAARDALKCIPEHIIRFGPQSMEKALGAFKLCFEETAIPYPDMYIKRAAQALIKVIKKRPEEEALELVKSLLEDEYTQKSILEEFLIFLGESKSKDSSFFFEILFDLALSDSPTINETILENLASIAEKIQAGELTDLPEVIKEVKKEINSDSNPFNSVLFIVFSILEAKANKGEATLFSSPLNSGNTDKQYAVNKCIPHIFDALSENERKSIFESIVANVEHLDTGVGSHLFYKLSSIVPNLTVGELTVFLKVTEHIAKNVDGDIDLRTSAFELWAKILHKIGGNWDELFNSLAQLIKLEIDELSEYTAQSLTDIFIEMPPICSNNAFPLFKTMATHETQYIKIGSTALLPCIIGGLSKKDYAEAQSIYHGLMNLDDIYIFMPAFVTNILIMDNLPASEILDWYLGTLKAVKSPSLSAFPINLTKLEENEQKKLWQMMKAELEDGASQEENQIKFAENFSEFFGEIHGDLRSEAWELMSKFVKNTKVLTALLNSPDKSLQCLYPQELREILISSFTNLKEKNNWAVSKYGSSSLHNVVCKAIPSLTLNNHSELTGILLEILSLYSRNIGTSQYDKFLELLFKELGLTKIDAPLLYLQSDFGLLRKKAVQYLTENLLTPGKTTLDNIVIYLKILKVASNSTFRAEYEDLIKLAKEAVSKLANGGISTQDLKLLNNHFTELSQIEEAKAFLKTKYIQVLREGKLAETECEFIINCITKLGLTTMITTNTGRITFENITYTMEDNTDLLNNLVHRLLQESDDMLAAQYKNGKPSFINTGSALPIAEMDKMTPSIVDDSTKLSINKWYASLMCLVEDEDTTPNDIEEPGMMFILLERKDESGRYQLSKLGISECKDGPVLNLIDQITLDTDKVSSEFRQKIFGKMQNTSGKTYSYFCKSTNLPFKQGQELIAMAKNKKILEGSEEEEDGLFTALCRIINIEEYEYEEFGSYSDYLDETEDDEESSYKYLDKKTLLDLDEKEIKLDEAIQIATQASIQLVNHSSDLENIKNIINVVNHIEFENKLLNHMVLFSLAIKSFGFSKALDLSFLLCDELVDSVIINKDQELLFAGMVSVCCNEDFINF